MARGHQMTNDTLAHINGLHILILAALTLIAAYIDTRNLPKK